MASQDFYEVLGIARNATAEDIRRAHRKLALKYHPDRNKSPDAQKRFTEVQRAYDVLSDEKKRAAYDRYGEAGLHEGAESPGGPHGPWSSPGGRGTKVNVNGVDMDAEDLSSVFDAFFGGGRNPFAEAGSGPRSPGARSGTGRQRAARAETEPSISEVTVPFLTAAKGGNVTVRDGQKSIDVSIPAGIEEGSQLRVRTGRGGELLLKVRIEPHALFRRGEEGNAGKGLDLMLDLPLTYAEAALGASVRVPTLEGPVELRIPAGASSGKKLRLRGKGITTKDGRYGDLYARVLIVPPATELSDEEARILRDLSERGGSVRSGPAWHGTT